MKENKKKWLYCLCCCILCICVVACSKVDNSQPESSSSNSTTESETEETTQPILYEIEKVVLVYEDVTEESDTWIVGKAISMDFTVNGEYSKFKNIAIDGKHFYSNGYTIKEDGKVISIPANYFDNYVEIGDHILTVKYEDGEVETTFHVAFEVLPPLEGYYKYPFTSDDEEWASFSITEKMRISRIKQNVLDSMNDDQLAQAVVDYPFLPFVSIYSSDAFGAQAVAKMCDAYAELLRRGTAKDALIAKMKEIEEDETVERTTKWKLFELIDGEASFEDEFTEEDRKYLDELRPLYD